MKTLSGSRLLAVALALACLAGCARTERARKVTTTGFLSDYSLLKQTKGDKAQLLYIRGKVPWASYEKVIVEPVTIWRVKGSPIEKLPQEDLDRLGAFFHGALVKELGKTLKVVTVAGPKTLRVRIALTELQKSQVTMNVITTVLPIGLAVSATERLTIGTHSFVGKAAAELEVTDSLTSQMLVGAVAARVGGKLPSGGTLTSWGQVEEIAEGWAARFAENLARLRRGEDILK